MIFRGPRRSVLPMTWPQEYPVSTVHTWGCGPWSWCVLLAVGRDAILSGFLVVFQGAYSANWDGMELDERLDSRAISRWPAAFLWCSTRGCTGFMGCCTRRFFKGSYWIHAGKVSSCKRWRGWPYKTLASLLRNSFNFDTGRIRRILILVWATVLTKSPGSTGVVPSSVNRANLFTSSVMSAPIWYMILSQILSDIYGIVKVLAPFT